MGPEKRKAADRVEADFAADCTGMGKDTIVRGLLSYMKARMLKCGEWTYKSTGSHITMLQGITQQVRTVYSVNKLFNLLPIGHSSLFHSEVFLRV